MKIAIDARELRTSTGRYIERLLHYLQQIDHANEYIVLLKPADFDGWQPSSANFTKLVCPYKEFSFGEQLGFRRQLKGLRVDLVHFGMVQQPIFYRGSVVTTMHDLITLRFRNPAKNPIVFVAKQQVYRLLNHVAARKSKRVIVPTEFVKRDIVKFAHIKPSKVVVTLESADKITASAEPIPGVEPNNYITYVGRPQPHKNLSRLIEAFALIKRTHPNLKLVLAGKKDADGLFDRLEALADKHGLKGEVIFPGFISEGQLRWLYENASAYVFPSLSEGFGLPALEAIVHGCPVVSSNATCLPEVYGEAALFFNPRDINDMATKVNQVLDDDKLRQNLIAKGKTQAKKYSWRRMAEQTLAVYNSVK